MVSYLLRMMTSWALVCNVWYLPAMHQQVCFKFSCFKSTAAKFFIFISDTSKFV